MEISYQSALFYHDIESLLDKLEQICSDRQIFILTDSHLQGLWLEKILPSRDFFNGAEILVTEPGEESKSIEVCSHLWSHLLECNADRQAIMLNIGGGSITDLGGFTASVYKRGIGFIHIPTSLLAMVDAANGGKTGINHHHIKNSIGSFHQPEAILVCTDFLTTLASEELKSGFAEMLKHALIKDKSLWEELSAISKLSKESITPYIKRSVEIKEEIVRSDFFEHGERKLLNFGHTIGHAIEAYCLQNQQEIRHGDAVALGMICEVEISLQQGMINSADCESITATLRKFYDPNNYSLPEFSALTSYLLNDKKNRNGNLLFSLLSDIGQAKYNVPVSLDEVSRAYKSVFEK